MYMTCKGVGEENSASILSSFLAGGTGKAIVSNRFVGFLWGENSHSNLARKELHFYCFLKLCPVAATHATTSWADVLLGTF